MARELVTGHLGREAMLAMQAVTDAMRLAREVEQEAAVGALSKPDASPVTVADFSVQALVAARLIRDFPSDTLVAEEDASALRGQPDLFARVLDLVRRADPALEPERVPEWIDRGGGTPGRRFWTLDPIDGTKGLLSGRQYVIALALIVDDVVRVGVLGCPRLSLRDGADRSMAPVIPRDVASAAPMPQRDEWGVAVAVRGCGAWWSSRADRPLARLSVSPVREAKRLRVLHSFESSHSDVDQLHRVLKRLGVDAPPVLMDSQAKHVVVAGGGADMLLRFPPKRDFHDAIWDLAAGAVLIEEAGGRVTDLTGREFDFSTGRRLMRNAGLVASNGVLHEAVLAAVRR